MTDPTGTTHAIATIEEAAGIGGLNLGQTITKSASILLSNYSTSSSVSGAPRTVSDTTVHRVYVGPFTTSKQLNISITITGSIHYVYSSGQEETLSDLDTSMSKINYGYVSSTSSTSFSGPSWESSISTSSPIEKDYTYSSQYIMLEWPSDLSAYIAVPGSVSGLSSSTGLVTCIITVELDLEEKPESNRCILLSELSLYNCVLKSPVPSGVSYVNNRTVEWYDITYIDTSSSSTADDTDEGDTIVYLSDGTKRVYKITGTLPNDFCPTAVDVSVIRVIVGKNITAIGSSAFHGFGNMTSITIPNTVAAIQGWYAFRYCTSLTSIVIPNSVTSLGKETFSVCKGLTSVILSSNLTAIDEGDFRACYGLTSISIPSSVTSIGNSAFAACTGLSSITCNSATPPTLGTDVFAGCSKLTSIYVPTLAAAIAYKSQWSDYADLIKVKKQSNIL